MYEGNKIQKNDVVLYIIGIDLERLCITPMETL